MAGAGKPPGFNNRLPSGGGMLSQTLCVDSGLVTVEGHVSGVTEPNHQLAQSGTPRKRSTDVRVRFQQRELRGNDASGAPGCTRFPCREELTTALEPKPCPFRDDYSWHS